MPTIKIHEMSYSGLSSYLICPLKFRYSYIDQLMPEFTPASLAFGSGIHSALEAYYTALKEGKPPINIPIMVNIVRNALENESILFDKESKDELIDKAQVMLHQAIAMPVGEKIIGTEVPVELVIEPGFTVIGKIDLVTEETGIPVITDFKTACRKPSQNDVDTNNQLTTYSCVYPDAKPRIRALTKCKSPDCVDLLTQRSDEQRTRVRKIFKAVKTCIEANSFFPNEGWQCEGCQYRTYCKKEF